MRVESMRRFTCSCERTADVPVRSGADSLMKFCLPAGLLRTGTSTVAGNADAYSYSLRAFPLTPALSLEERESQRTVLKLIAAKGCVGAFANAWDSPTRMTSAVDVRRERRVFLPLPKGLSLLGKQGKEFAAGEGPLRAERAGASESLGRGEGERTAQTGSTTLSCEAFKQSATSDHFHTRPPGAPARGRRVRVPVTTRAHVTGRSRSARTCTHHREGDAS
jgi:hypothetical protein